VRKNQLQSRLLEKAPTDCPWPRLTPDGRTLALEFRSDVKKLIYFDLVTGTIRKDHELPEEARHISFSPIRHGAFA
jgi:hypothetical protein